MRTSRRCLENAPLGTAGAGAGWPSRRNRWQRARLGSGYCLPNRINQGDYMKTKQTTEVIKRKEPNQLVEHIVKLDNYDCNVVIEWPNGHCVTLQIRSSNAYEKYAGSLDILLPKDMPVVTWKGDDMAPSVATSKKHPEERVMKQMVVSMEEEWYPPIDENA